MSKAEIQTYIESLGFAMIPDESGENAKFWIDGARDFWCGIALFLLDIDIHTSFISIVKAILNGNFTNVIEKIKNSQCFEAISYVASYEGANEKNTAGCYNKLVSAVRQFTLGDLPNLLNSSGDCITPETLEDGFDVYIEIPQDKIEVYAPITAMIVQNFMTAFMQRADVGKGEKSRPILFLLDEFPQLQFKFETLSAALSTLRSKKVSLFLAMQSLAQLQKRYGNEGSREIIDTCAYISVMSAQDPESRKFFQELIGTEKTMTVVNAQDPSNGGHFSRTIQRDRDFIYQAESFGNLNDHVVICANGKFIEAEKCYCFAD